MTNIIITLRCNVLNHLEFVKFDEFERRKFAEDLKR